jgi:hypothetical protein
LSDATLVDGNWHGSTDGKPDASGFDAAWDGTEDRGFASTSVMSCVGGSAEGETEWKLDHVVAGAPEQSVNFSDGTFEKED